MSYRTQLSLTSSNSKGFMCGHNLPPVLKSVRLGENARRKFYACAKWPDDNCDFFKWENQIYKEDLLTKNEVVEEKVIKIENLIRDREIECKSEVIEVEESHNGSGNKHDEASTSQPSNAARERYGLS